MGEAQTPHFYDFWIFEPVTFLSLATPGHLNKIKKKPWNCFYMYYFINVEFGETQHVDIFRKDGHRKLMKVRLMESPKSWICISYLSKIMKWKLGNMYQISFKNIKH